MHPPTPLRHKVCQLISLRTMSASTPVGGGTPYQSFFIRSLYGHFCAGCLSKIEFRFVPTQTAAHNEALPG